MTDTAPRVYPPDPNAPAADAAFFRERFTASLLANVDGWQPVDPTNAPDQASAALIGVVARFCEIIVQRLNQVPDKNFLAFLDLLGASLLPPQAARVPLTYTLAANSPIDAVVPAGTQAAAPPGSGQKDPVIFETERELTVVAATLQALFAADSDADLVADHSALLASPANTGVAIFTANGANEHVVYFGHASLLSPNVQAVTLTIAGQEPNVPAGVTSLFKPKQLIWESWDGSSWQPMAPGPLKLPDAVSGTYVFPKQAWAAPFVMQTIGGVTSCWLRGRLNAPIASSTVAPASGPSASVALLPTYTKVEVSTSSDGPAKLDAVFVNAQPVDNLRPFFPFGERPKLGDALYIGSGAFALPGATITLAFAVANPTGTAPPNASVPPVQAHGVRLKWEAWDGVQWSSIGESATDVTGAGTFTDGTHAFTQTGDATFTLPPSDSPNGLMPVEINGVTSYWVRVRIKEGNYGLDTHFATDGTVVPANLTPPFLESLGVSSRASQPKQLADVVAFNNLQFDDVGALLAQGRPVLPFRALAQQPPSLYLAFTIPAVRSAFPNRPISLYHGLASPVYGKPSVPIQPHTSLQTVTAGASTIDAEHEFTLANIGTETVTYQLQAVEGTWPRTLSLPDKQLAPGETVDFTVTVHVPPTATIPAGKVDDVGVVRAVANGRISSAIFATRLSKVAARQRRVHWEYWNGASWTRLEIVDGTNELTESGVVEFLGPSDIALVRNFGVTAYWLRALFDEGDGGEAPPFVQTLLPNTTLAAQTLTALNEPLGSSDAAAGQRFRTARAPVLAGPQLEVREPAPLTSEEVRALEAAQGESGVVTADTGGTNEVWVRWIEVPDLYASAPTDRHYVLDHISGEVRFGDGAQGRIPPRGAGNIRMARYQTGGGSVGNVEAGTVVQMKTTVPFVEKVANLAAAAGGFGAESVDELRARAPRTLRHGGRAVAAEDYEDIARLASSEVARAKCVPLRLLKTDLLGKKEEDGALSLIILPGTSDPKPLPSAELLARVASFVSTRQAANARLDVVGPLYVRVDVTLEVALTRLEGASQVEQAIRAKLAAFLHPLTGGRDGTGWDFGRQPHTSDLHAIVAVPGVDHVRQLSFTQNEEVSGLIDAGRYLIFSGQHQITLTLAGAQ
jgi:hypothetical protein